MRRYATEVRAPKVTGDDVAAMAEQSAAVTEATSAGFASISVPEAATAP